MTIKMMADGERARVTARNPSREDLGGVRTRYSAASTVQGVAGRRVGAMQGGGGRVAMAVQGRAGGSGRGVRGRGQAENRAGMSRGSGSRMGTQIEGGGGGFMVGGEKAAIVINRGPVSAARRSFMIDGDGGGGFNGLGGKEGLARFERGKDGGRVVVGAGSRRVEDGRVEGRSMQGGGRALQGGGRVEKGRGGAEGDGKYDFMHMRRANMGGFGGRYVREGFRHGGHGDGGVGGGGGVGDGLDGGRVGSGQFGDRRVHGGGIRKGITGSVYTEQEDVIGRGGLRYQGGDLSMGMETGLLLIGR